MLSRAACIWSPRQPEVGAVGADLGPWKLDRSTSAGDRRGERLGHRPVPGRGVDEAQQVGRAIHLELIEQEPDLRGLRGEDLVLRGKLPELPLERADRLLAGRVDELRVR